MAQDIIIDGNEWIDLTTLFGLLAGDPILVQNTGSQILRVETSELQPTETDNGLGLAIFAVASAAPVAPEKVWALSVGQSKGKLQQVLNVKPFKGGSVTPGEAVQLVTDGLGYTSWLSSQNIIYFEENGAGEDLEDFFLNDNVGEFPNGYYSFPEESTIQVDGAIQHSLPIKYGANCTLIGTTSVTHDSFEYRGGNGNGPVSLQDAAHYNSEGILTIDCVAIIESVGSDTVGILCEASTLFITDVLFFISQAMAFYESVQLLSLGENLIIAQGTPITFNNMAVDSQVILTFNGFSNAFGGAAASTDDVFDLTGLDIIDPDLDGKVTVLASGCNANMADISWAFFRVTDDNTVHQGTYRNNILDEDSDGVFIDGIDERALNSFFAGNNFNNTSPNIELSMAGNLIATLDPGDNVTWVPIDGVFSINAADATWFDDNGNTNADIKFLKNLTDRFRGNTSGSIVRAAGGGSVIVEIGAFLNVEATPFKTVPVTISNVPVAIPGLLTKKQLTQDDVVSYKIRWPISNGFNVLVSEFTGVWD